MRLRTTPPENRSDRRIPKSFECPLFPAALFFLLPEPCSVIPRSLRPVVPVSLLPQHFSQPRRQPRCLENGLQEQQAFPRVFVARQREERLLQFGITAKPLRARD